MKTTLPLSHHLTVALAAAITACAPPPPPAPDLAAIEAEVRTASRAVAAAEAAKDIETALTFWTADAVVHAANEPMSQGLDGVRAAYEGLFAEEVGLAEFESTTTAIHVASSGDLAWEHGSNRMVFNTPAGPMTDMGKYMVIWSKRDGAWKVAAIAFSSDAPPPVAPPM